jgi:formiminotetrahydrofolate cyclodeaminase
MLTAIMIEKNHDEERLARVEQMLEALQQQAEAPKTVIANVDVLQMSLTRDATPRRRRTDLQL